MLIDSIIHGQFTYKPFCFLINHLLRLCNILHTHLFFSRFSRIYEYMSRCIVYRVQNRMSELLELRVVISCTMQVQGIKSGLSGRPHRHT